MDISKFVIIEKKTKFIYTHRIRILYVLLSILMIRTYLMQMAVGYHNKELCCFE